ncbi:putative disease resistance RPP13-like protein 1 [Carex rostrata]
MATRILSSIYNLTSKILSKIQGCSVGSGIPREVERLSNIIIRIRTVLTDAEEREITDQSEKSWLHELKQVAYDAEDILSDFNYHWDSMEIGYQEQIDSRKRKFEVIDSIFSPRYDSSFLYRIERITKQFDEICHARDTLCLREEDGIRKFQSRTKPPSSSFVNPLEIFGRESEKREVIDALLTKTEKLSILKRTIRKSRFVSSRVVAIVGMAGIGKTTVAKLVFNDKEVQEKFQLKGWVWVSEFHDEIAITKSIIESFTYKECGLCQLDALRFRLEDVLVGKKFFLVLNDLWDENSSRWEVIQWLLDYGAKGSRILITTENNTIAEHMGAKISIHLVALSRMDSWALFSHHAFNRGNTIMVPSKILEIGLKIVQKCSGVPLIVKALGALLALSTEERTWEYFLHSNAWDLEECRKSMHILNLSYHGLPTHLKSCFRSRAMFPKGYEFEIDSLVQIWAAQGLIQADDNRQIEVGRMYVDELMRRSFFQNKVVHGKKCKFTMHSLMHDLSKWIAGEETAIVENKELGNNISKDCRHLTVLVKKDGPVLFNPRCQSLRSLFIYSYTQTRFDLDRHFFYHEFLQYLNVLDLNFWKAMELPESIGNFKHLRFLGLSGQSLPESICNLRNLQTLRIRTRGKQLTLPKRIYLLKNLRHLIFSPWDVLMIPSGIGLLTNLRSLSAFVISKEEGSATLNELAKLKNLRDELHITGLHHIIHESTSNSIYNKLASNLTHLTLHWSTFNISQNQNNDERLLCNLQPQTNIQNIVVEGYRGEKLPLWFEDPQFTRLTYLKLDNCTNCKSLPAIGHLPALKHLKLEGLKKLKIVGQEFYGNSMISFPSLETLSFYDMPELEKLYRRSREGSDFPCLRELHVSLCQKLRSLQLSNLPALHKASINWCQLAVIEGLDGKWLVVNRWEDTSTGQPEGICGNFRETPNSFRGGLSRGSSVLKLEKSSETNNSENISPTLIIVGCPMFEKNFCILDKKTEYNTVSSTSTTVHKGSRYGLIQLDRIKKVLYAPAAVGLGSGEYIEQKADKNNLPLEEENMHPLYKERENHNAICNDTAGESAVPEGDSRDKEQVMVDNEDIFPIEDFVHLSLKQNQEQNSPMGTFLQKSPPGLRNKILLGLTTLVSAPTTSTTTSITPPSQKINHISY